MNIGFLPLAGKISVINEELNLYQVSFHLYGPDTGRLFAYSSSSSALTGFRAMIDGKTSRIIKLRLISKFFLVFILFTENIIVKQSFK